MRRLGGEKGIYGCAPFALTNWSSWYFQSFWEAKVEMRDDFGLGKFKWCSNDGAYVQLRQFLKVIDTEHGDLLDHVSRPCFWSEVDEQVLRRSVLWWWKDDDDRRRMFQNQERQLHLERESVRWVDHRVWSDAWRRSCSWSRLGRINWWKLDSCRIHNQ